jgi:hypothetical protein
MALGAAAGLPSHVVGRATGDDDSHEYSSPGTSTCPRSSEASGVAGDGERELVAPVAEEEDIVVGGCKARPHGE